MFFGFEPVYNSESKILILGSFPSVKSRGINFYYGNKQNRFWKMLSSILGENAGESTEEKKKFLLRHKIALWDIVYSCEIVGSLDSDLKCEKIVDLSFVLSACNIEKIICNGTKAFELFKKHYPSLNAICLPSTSPANVRFDINKWQSALKE